MTKHPSILHRRSTIKYNTVDVLHLRHEQVAELPAEVHVDDAGDGVVEEREPLQLQAEHLFRVQLSCYCNSSVTRPHSRGILQSCG